MGVIYCFKQHFVEIYQMTKTQQTHHNKMLNESRHVTFLKNDIDINFHAIICIMVPCDIISVNVTSCKMLSYLQYEPPHGKTNNLHRRKQRRRSALQADHAFVFSTRIVQSSSFLNPKFQASSLLL